METVEYRPQCMDLTLNSTPYRAANMWWEEDDLCFITDLGLKVCIKEVRPLIRNPEIVWRQLPCALLT